MTKKAHIAYIVVIVLMTILLVNPKTDNKNDVIEIPAIEGTFDTDSIKPVENNNKKEVIYLRDTIQVPETLNEELLNKYAVATDSIERLNLYIDMIQTRKYVQKFVDEKVEIKVETEVLGKLEDMKIDYTVFKRELPKQRQPIVIRGGADMQVINEFTITPRISIEDRKGKVYSTSFRENYLTIGVEAPLFKIK